MVFTVRSGDLSIGYVLERYVLERYVLERYVLETRTSQVVSDNADGMIMALMGLIGKAKLT